MTPARLDSDAERERGVTVFGSDGTEARGGAGEDVDCHFLAGVVEAGVLEGGCGGRPGESS